MGETRPESSGSHIADPGKQARSASGIPIVPVFDGYRAFAILGVVLLHLITFSGVVQVGDEGLLSRLTWGSVGRCVEVLFIVSGFVVFLPTVARGGSFGSVGFYAIRRAARLLPAYWLILGISMLLLATVTLPPSTLAFAPETDFPNLISVLSNFAGAENLMAMLFNDVSIGFGTNPALWTLSIELGFYLVLPLVASVYFRHPWAGLAVAAAVTLLWTIASDHLVSVTDFLGLNLDFNDTVRIFSVTGIQLPAWAFSFALGMTGAWVYVRVISEPPGERLRQTLLRVLLVSSLLTVALAVINGGYFDQTRDSIWLSMAFSLALATFMVSLALVPRQYQSFLASGPVRKLGDISYGIYLSHLLVMIYLGRYVLDLPRDGTLGDLLLWVVVVVPAAVLYGYLSARFLEQPVRRWARGFGNRNEA